MKRELKKYRGKRIGGVQIKISDVIKPTPKNRKILDKYLTDVRGSAGEKRSKKIEREMLVIYDTSEVDLDKWDYDVLSEFLSVLNNTELAKYTSNDYKKTLKHFLKFQYQDWNVRFKELRHNGLKQTNPVNKEKISKETLLKPNEFDLLVRGCDKPLFRAYIHLAYKSAGRPEELLKLRWGDVDLKTGRLRLDSSKTGNKRYIYIDDDCKNDLLKYKENEYGYPNATKDDFIFVSPVRRDIHISMTTIYSYIKTTAKNKINREDIFPYLFRHTRLNFLRKQLSPDAYESFADHSLETGMKFYSHNDDEDLRDELYSKVFEKKEMPVEEKIRMQQEIDQLQKDQATTNKAMQILIKSLTNKTGKPFAHNSSDEEELAILELSEFIERTPQEKKMWDENKVKLKNSLK
jgi:integrase